LRFTVPNIRRSDLSQDIADMKLMRLRCPLRRTDREYGDGNVRISYSNSLYNLKSRERTHNCFYKKTLIFHLAPLFLPRQPAQRIKNKSPPPFSGGGVFFFYRSGLIEGEKMGVFHVKQKRKKAGRMG
jgi:hypothetical protein